jgi:methyl-accepting chemotaxis protein
MFPQSCRAKLMLLGILIGVMVAVNSFLIFRVIQSNSQINDLSYPTASLANTMELSVIQVQQFLSDIRATRAQESGQYGPRITDGD